MGIGDWGLGPIPNPQCPIPNPPLPKLFQLNLNPEISSAIKLIFFLIFIFLFLFFIYYLQF
ncbi:MAG: hypothetical protein MJ252_08825 [archaeon]|nr:hypothetical protein [archaeon]